MAFERFDILPFSRRGRRGSFPSTSQLVLFLTVWTIASSTEVLATLPTTTSQHPFPQEQYKSTEETNRAQSGFFTTPVRGNRQALAADGGVGDVISSWNHTNRPSPSPTASVAPSPTPTKTPTSKPTRKPTAAPTTSMPPTDAPTSSPSDVPSRSPSQGPTAHPTITRYPTIHPSASPSMAPSVAPSIPPTPAPTVSHQPSSQPSISPTFSPSGFPTVSPTTSPTFVGTQTTHFQVTLPFAFLLNETEVTAFVRGSEAWIPQADLDGERNDGTLSQPQVVFEKQSLVSATTRSHERSLQEGGTSATSNINAPNASVLSLEFRVTVVYKGSDSSFNLYLALNPLLQLPDPLWVHMLGNYNDLFLQMRDESTVPPAISGVATSQNKNVNLSDASIAVISLVVIGAVGLGAVAVAVGMREYKLAMIGTELHSPTGGGSGQDGYFNNEVESMLQDPQAIGEGLGPVLNGEHGVIIASTLNEIPNPRPEQMEPPSPLLRDPVLYFDAINENDGSYATNQQPRGPRDDSIGEIFRGHAVIGRTGSDPPTANSEAGVSATMARASRSVPHDYMRRRALMDDNSTRRESGASSSIRTATTGFNEPHQMKPINRVEGSGAAGSDAYAASQVSSYYGANRDTGSGTLGALPLARDTSFRRQSVRSNPSFDSSVVPRAGLYDVFAPSGPIGIIVDTTKDGPVVHSLKASSPMRGLINPGDLIVALDDKDTRGMTAATLTRLMAKKAHQKERKITLLATDPY